MFDSILTGTLTLSAVLVCTLCSLLLGLGVSLCYRFRGQSTRSFATTLVLLPAVTQMVIMLVNGSVGTAVAVMGAFSLIRFRSVAGSAREIGAIFLAMALGLCVGAGYVALSFVFLALLGGAMLLLELSGFGAPKADQRELRISIPESLDYEGLFDDLLDSGTKAWHLERVRTTNMGSLYELSYQVTLAGGVPSKAFLDEIRTRNGNLPVSVGRVGRAPEEL